MTEKAARIVTLLKAAAVSIVLPTPPIDVHNVTIFSPTKIQLTHALRAESRNEQHEKRMNNESGDEPQNKTYNQTETMLTQPDYLILDFGAVSAVDVPSEDSNASVSRC